MHQAATDVAVLAGTYHGLKRLPGARARTLRYVRQHFPPGSPIHGKMLAMLGKDYERELAAADPVKKWMTSRYAPVLRVNDRVRGEILKVPGPFAADRAIQQLRSDAKLHVHAAARARLAARKAEWGKLSPARKLRIQSRMQRAAIRLRTKEIPRLRARLARRALPWTVRLRRTAMIAGAGAALLGGAYVGYRLYRRRHRRAE